MQKIALAEQLCESSEGIITPGFCYIICQGKPRVTRPLSVHFNFNPCRNDTILIWLRCRMGLSAMQNRERRGQTEDEMGMNGEKMSNWGRTKWGGRVWELCDCGGYKVLQGDWSGKFLAMKKLITGSHWWVRLLRQTCLQDWLMLINISIERMWTSDSLRLVGSLKKNVEKAERNFP